MITLQNYIRKLKKQEQINDAEYKMRKLAGHTDQRSDAKILSEYHH